jgi:hypothetical protein
MDSIEFTIDKVADYIRNGAIPEPGHSYIWQVRELAQKTGVSPLLLGKVRKSFKLSLAQAIAGCGIDHNYQIIESKMYGVNAITLKNAAA